MKDTKFLHFIFKNPKHFLSRMVYYHRFHRFKKMQVCKLCHKSLFGYYLQFFHNICVILLSLNFSQWKTFITTINYSFLEFHWFMRQNKTVKCNITILDIFNATLTEILKTIYYNILYILTFKASQSDFKSNFYRVMN